MSKQSKEKSEDNSPSIKVELEKKCGLVMPISECDNCSEQHWAEVRDLVTEALNEVGFAASMVSNADEVGVIQSRIVDNLYTNPIVVCDVSGKNPNVMFELGMRLAFDKPTIIIKDDRTTYSFDTSPIEHIGYPRDLRFSKIVEFKETLGQKVFKTWEKSNSDPDFSCFLQHFGKQRLAKLERSGLTKEDFIIEEIQVLKGMIQRRDSDSKPITEFSNKAAPFRPVFIPGSALYRSLRRKALTKFGMRIARGEVSVEEMAEFLQHPSVVQDTYVMTDQERNDLCIFLIKEFMKEPKN